MDLQFVGSSSVIVILLSILMYYLSDSWACNKNLKDLRVKYEQDTTPIKLQIEDLKTQVFSLETERSQLQENLARTEARRDLVTRNVLGKFTKGELTSLDGKCVSIADSSKGDLTFLQVKQTLKCNPIFSYEPNYKQISVSVGTATKCVDAFNENEIVLNDCIKNSQKQKFDYYPIFDGRLKSQLYSKCLGYNKESGILQLRPCDSKDAIIVKDSAKHLALINP